MVKILKTNQMNGVWLKPGEWLVVMGVVLGLLWGVVPRWHARRLHLELPADFRLSYGFRDDYLLYRGVAQAICEKHSTLFIGDSVIWGMYVSNGHTLPALINRRHGNEDIGNLAVDGLHPVAMETLVREYGQAIRGKRVYVYLNPLWLTSPLYDLSGDGELSVNHPRLLPQFSPSLRCYHASLDDRCKATMERLVDFQALLHHVRVAFFDNQDIKRQIVKQGDEAPWTRLSCTLSPVETGHAHDSLVTWEDAGIAEQDWPWVSLDESLQWASYLRTLELLKARGNSVVAMVGALNPHMQSAASLKACRQLHADALARLAKLGYETVDFPELPSDEYGDASHPLAKGYERMALEF